MPQLHGIVQKNMGIFDTVELLISPFKSQPDKIEHADDVPEVFLPDGKFDVRVIHWLPSYIEDQLYLQMCESKRTATADAGDESERKVNWYYFEAAKYAFRRSAGDFSGENTKCRPVFRLKRVDFSARLKAELAKLPKETIHRIMTEAVFRIFRARHKMIFYQYIQNERLKWEFD